MWKMHVSSATLLSLALIADQVKLHFFRLLCVCCIYVLRGIHVPLDGSSSQSEFAAFAACQLSSDDEVFRGGRKVPRRNECDSWFR
jgi:hypothetical protein